MATLAELQEDLAAAPLFDGPLPPALTLADSPRAEMVADAFHWNMPHGAFGAYAERGYQMAREIALAKLEGYAEPEVVDLVRRADHGDFAETLYPLQPNK